MGHQKRLLQAFAVLCGIFCLVAAVKKADRFGSIQVKDVQLPLAGITHEYELFLMADTHISLCDERDPGLLEKADSRRQAFEQESGKIATRTFHNLVTEAMKGHTDLAVFAGDITDSAMYASIDFVQKEVSRLDMPYLYITGNHDFEYGDEYFSKKAYRDYFPRLQGLTGTAGQYVVWEDEDLIVVGINDKNNQFPKSAVKALLPLMQGSKPVIVVLHVPLQPQYENSELEQQADDIWGLSAKGRCRVLIGETACKPNKTTQKMLDAIFDENSPVAAVLAGHIHFYNESMLDGAAVQLVTGAGYYGDAVRVHIIPACDKVYQTRWRTRAYTGDIFGKS